MRLINRIILRIKLYFAEYQFREAKSIWYNSRGTSSEEAAYNVLLKYQSLFNQAKRNFKLSEI